MKRPVDSFCVLQQEPPLSWSARVRAAESRTWFLFEATRRPLTGGE